MRMTNLELLIKGLDSAHWELSEALKNFPNEDLWVRPHAKLLSVGELLVHLTYWQGQSILEPGYESLFPDEQNYYTSNLENPIVLDLNVQDVADEVARIHRACKKRLTELAPAIEDPCPNREGWTWGYVLEYQLFHISYHTGQVYSARHVLGHDTVDN